MNFKNYLRKSDFLPRFSHNKVARIKIHDPHRLTPTQILNNVFGLPAFRLGQDVIINSIIQGNNAFVLLVFEN